MTHEAKSATHEAQRTLWDITLPLRRDLAVWPGDTPFDLSLAWQMSAGAAANVGAATMSLHTGTHADAPFHFQSDGATIDALPLEIFIGPAWLLDVAGRDPIGAADLEHLDFSATPRLLLRTGAWPDPTRFPDTIPTVADDVPVFLGQRGVVLLGLDVPSVDALDSRDLPNHHALARNGIHIVESLRLTDVPPGRYEFIALPLPFVGGDASPLRAVLRELVE